VSQARLSLAAGMAVLTALSVALAWPVPGEWFADREARRVVDRHGEVLAEVVVPNLGRAHWVELDQVSRFVVDALIAAEDHRFDGHRGVDPLAVLRAGVVDLRAGAPVQGGSTLTQQTVRLLVERPPGLRGKVVEAWRAVRLEQQLSKEQILTWYLNRAYFGHRAWRVEAAARTYFDESPAGLSLAEAATLVGLLPEPSRRDPWVEPSRARSARDRVIERMVATGALTRAEADLALAEPMQLRRPRRPRVAPHLADRLLDEHPHAPVVHTTVDRLLQADVEELVGVHVGALAGRDVDHAAVLVADVATGEVLAWVGSADPDAEDGQVDGVRARRSPGSALKPFVYGIAFERGMSPADVLPDLPRRFTTSHGTWAPTNYSDDHLGPVRARIALACSLNLPAVAVLEDVGTATLLHRLRRAGLTTLDRRASHYGLGLVLGDGEVTLEELTAAYAALARGGVYRPLTVVRDQPRPRGQRILDARAAWLVADVLDDPVARTPAFGRWGSLERAYPVAAKTGTSTGFRDNWTVGYTPRHVVGVWVGNFDGRPMGSVSGITGAGPLWAAVMDRVTGEATEDFPRPKGLVRRRACGLSGERPSPACPDVVEDWFLRGQAERPECDWHVQMDGRVAVRWPSTYAAWAAVTGRADPAAPAAPDRLDQVGIAFPSSGSTFHVDPSLPTERQRVPLRAATPAGARRAIWEVDGRVVAEVGPPFVHLWLPDGPGEHRIELEVDGEHAPPIRVWVGGVDEPDGGG